MLLKLLIQVVLLSGIVVLILSDILLVHRSVQTWDTLVFKVPEGEKNTRRGVELCWLFQIFVSVLALVKV